MTLGNVLFTSQPQINCKWWEKGLSSTFKKKKSKKVFHNKNFRYFIILFIFQGLTYKIKNSENSYCITRKIIIPEIPDKEIQCFSSIVLGSLKNL